MQRFKIEADAAIPPGTHQVRMEFAYDGGGPAKGGSVTLYLNGDKTGEGRVEATVPLIFSADETADVGRDTASPVSDDYEGESSVFTGTVNWVQIDRRRHASDETPATVAEPETTGPIWWASPSSGSLSEKARFRGPLVAQTPIGRLVLNHAVPG